MDAGDVLTKTEFDQGTGKLIGTHLIVVGEHELIQGCTVAVRSGVFAEDVMHTAFPHPALSEMIHGSALASKKALERHVNLGEVSAPKLGQVEARGRRRQEYK